MGSTGAFLSDGGFKYQGWANTGEKIFGIKVLTKILKNPNDKQSLPILSNTPGTAYLLLNEDGSFLQFRQFKENREPDFDIDYGEHHHKLTLHIHKFNGTKRSTAEPHIIVSTKRVKSLTKSSIINIRNF